MKTASLPAVGSLVKDTATGRTGVFMELWAGNAWLRPENGGTEWLADPEKLTAAEGES